MHFLKLVFPCSSIYRLTLVNNLELKTSVKLITVAEDKELYTEHINASQNLSRINDTYRERERILNVQRCSFTSHFKQAAFPVRTTNWPFQRTMNN